MRNLHERILSIEDGPRQEALAGKNRALLTDGAAGDGAEGCETVGEERLLREGY